MMCNMHWLELLLWRKTNSKILEEPGITSKNRDKFKKSFCIKITIKKRIWTWERKKTWIINTKRKRSTKKRVWSKRKSFNWPKRHSKTKVHFGYWSKSENIWRIVKNWQRKGFKIVWDFKNKKPGISESLRWTCCYSLEKSCRFVENYKEQEHR